jgi:hypothetical protein
MALSDIPALVKHVTLAIHDGKSVDGSGVTRFLRAFHIARGALVRQGFLVAGSEEGPTSKIKLTGKGLMKNNSHLHEGKAFTKSARFNALYQKAQIVIETQDSEETATKPSPREEQRELKNK